MTEDVKRELDAYCEQYRSLILSWYDWARQATDDVLQPLYDAACDALDGGKCSWWEEHASKQLVEVIEMTWAQRERPYNPRASMIKEDDDAT